MRRRLIHLVALGLVLSVSPAAAAVADPGDPPGAGPDRGARGLPDSLGPGRTEPLEHVTLESVTPEEAREDLETAERVLEGAAAPQDPSPTLALTTLSSALPSLEGRDRRQARAMLARPDEPAARPTDGNRDRFGDGYDRRAYQRCSRHFCLHFTRQGSDRRPDGAWVTRNLRVLEGVWRHHIGRLGYRRPLSDRGRGGSNKFDVYLKNIGFQGYYGYCAPERRPFRGRRLASGYCVLDNDFSRAEFGVPPAKALRVTAAHEFFHAIQYNYDVGEDSWLLEATATWIEERFADGINDNRQFLSAGQVAKPGRPLDLFNYGTRAPYGNWGFFEYLSTRFGNRIVRQIWNRAADFRGAPDHPSMRAVRLAVVAQKRSWPVTYARFAAANTTPAASYPEGRSWPRAPISQTFRLSSTRRGTGTVTRRLPHLTSRHVDVTRTRAGLPRRRALKVRVDGPARAAGPAAHAIVHLRGGKRVRRVLSLDKRGNTTQRLAFDRNVSRVTLTLANTSTRYRCWRGRSWSCRGIPRDDQRAYTLAATVVPRR